MGVYLYYNLMDYHFYLYLHIDNVHKVGYILYNYQLTAEGYCFSDGGKGFVVFNMNMENIGYWSPTEKGFNWFDNSAEWIYFIIK